MGSYLRVEDVELPPTEIDPLRIFRDLKAMLSPSFSWPNFSCPSFSCPNFSCPTTSRLFRLGVAVVGAAVYLLARHVGVDKVSTFESLVSCSVLPTTWHLHYLPDCSIVHTAQQKAWTHSYKNDFSLNLHYPSILIGSFKSCVHF